MIYAIYLGDPQLDWTPVISTQVDDECYQAVAVASDAQSKQGVNVSRVRGRLVETLKTTHHAKSIMINF